ncbi:MAG: DegV family protein [Dehalococcoidia bacterium]|nr:DegV family protein [Dehalococcoidia bacterium]
MNTFTIMVDSNCDLPSEYLEEHDIKVLSMPFSIDGVAHGQGYWQEISGKEYYDALRNGRVAKTSQINRNSFETVFSEYARQGRDLVCIVLSSGLSSTYQGAVSALQAVRTSWPECGIFVVDSINATSGHGLLAMLAVKKRLEGMSACDTASWLETKKHSCFALFTVDDLMYLHRGGRLSKLSAIAGTILSIKPVLNVAPDGTLRQKDKVRGRKAALGLMAEQLKRSINPETTLDTVLINHTDCPEDARMLADMIKAGVSVRQVVTMLMGPIIGAHLGPGAVTLLFEADMTREEYEGKFYR